MLRHGRVRRLRVTGPDRVVRDDWKNVFDDTELDKVITRMLKIKEIKR